MYVLFYFFIGLIIPYALSIASPVRFRFLGYDWNYPVLFAVIFIVLVRAFAYNTGTDYLLYYNHYQTLARGYSDAWGQHREIGYQWCIRILSSLIKNPALFFGFAGFIYTYSILMISRMFGKPERFILFLWPIFMFVLSFNLYRQYLAMSFIVLAVVFFYQKKYLVMGAMLVLSVLFHTSAIIGILLIASIWFYRERIIKVKILLLALGITTIMSKYVSVVLSNFADVFSVIYFYLTGKIYSTDSIVLSMYDTSSLIYINSIAYCVLIFYGYKLCEERPQYRFFYYLFSMACILEPVTRQEILMRLWLYLQIFTPVFLGILCYKYKNMLKYPILWGAVMYEFVYYLYTLNNLGTIHPLNFKF